MFMHRMRPFKLVALVFAVMLLAASGQLTTRADIGSPAEIVERAWDNAQSAGSYRFSSDITETLIPQPVPGMIGQQETTIGFTLDGAAQLPDRSYMEMRTTTGSRAIPAIIVLREAGQAYISQNGKLRAADDPSGIVMPEADALGYLGAAENVRPLEDISSGGERVARFAFDINGSRLAERVRAQSEATLRARPGAPDDVSVGALPMFQHLSGQGELWLDADGLPVRQIVDLEMPSADDLYQTHIHIVVDLRDYGLVQALPRVVQGADGALQMEGTVSIGQQAGLSGSSSVTTSKAFLRVSPTMLGLFVVVFCLLVAARYYRRNPKRAYNIIVSAVVPILIVGPLLQAGSMVEFREAEARAAESRTAAASQALQSLGLAREEVESRPAPGLDLSLKEILPASTSTGVAQAPARSLLTETGADDDYIEHCGQGSPTSDTDGDGLNDQLEGCLGTDPYEADSDNDGLSDGIEKNGFDYNGRHWVLNPKNTDSNGDSLSDYEELSTALGGLSAKLDTDDDGVPDVWDDDNDNDGALDYVDLSSEAVSPYAATQNLNIQGGSFDGYQYIEFHVQPEDQTHLRYATTALDWPFDDKGNVQDLDSSTEDVRLTPFMFITANVVPTELTREYGVRVWQTAGETIMLVPLQPVTDGGHTMAFYGKVVYAPDLAGRLDNINWNMKMVWMVQATIDSWVSGEVSPATSVLNQFSDPFRFSGLLVTRSRGYEVGVIGTPTTPVEDRNLFAVRQGLLLFYLGFEELEFQEPGQTALGQVQARFANPATPISYTWGVTPSLVAMDRISYSHRDAGLAGVGGDQVQDFLNSHYDYDLSDTSKLAVAVDDDGNSYYFKATSVLLATEEQAGVLDLEDMATGTTGTLSVNLSDVPIVTARSVKLVMYELLESGKWEMMAPSRLMQVVELRYRNRFDEINNPDYPYLIPNDYRFIAYLSYLSASVGMSAAIALDGQLLTEATPEYKGGWLTADLMNAAWSQVGYWVPNYMAIVTNVGESLQKLRSIDWWGRLTNQKAPDFIDEFSHLTPDIFAESLRPTRLQLADKWVGRVSMVFGAVVGAATLVMNVLQMSCGEGEDFACGNEKAFTIAGIVTGWACAATQAVSIASMAVQMVAKTLEAFKGATAGLAVVGTVLGMGAAWVTFGLTIAGAADSPVVIRNAVALVVATTIWLTFLLLINLVPVVGQIISAILCLIDTIINLITSLICGSENSWSVARAVAEFFYKAEVLTSLVTDPGPEYYDWSTTLRDEDIGLVAGNALELSSEFSGQMKKESGGSDSDLRSSWVKGEAFYGPATQGIAINANSYAECTVSDGVLYCHNMPRIIFGLPTARINNHVQFKVVTSFQYRFSESTLAGLVTTKSSKKGSIPDDDEDPEYNDFYLDVQPASLDDWWRWTAISNPDQDGDGLTDSQEATLGADPTLWDSDGDGLSDGFEDERGGDGYNLLQADSDQDGLNDMIEFRQGTKPNQCDSDQDGLWDSEEVYHEKVYAWDPCSGAIGDWVGGWNARMIGDEEIWVTSDPLKALTDADSLSDLAERENAYSPWARNDVAALSLALNPWASGENARPGMFVAPGDNVKLTLSLANYGTAPVTDTMTLCIANGIAGLSGGALLGDRPMNATVGSCEGGASYSWSFAGTQTLQLGDEVTTTLSGKAISTATSVYGSITVTLPYSDTVLTQASPFVIDADNPSASVSTPAADAVLRGSTYVVGGSASDLSSWVTQVDLGIGPQGSGKTFTETTGTNAWAYSWSLPADGRYELQARATDYVGHSALSAIVPVVVDNTPPTAVIASQGVVTSTGNIVTLTGTVTDNLSGVARVQISVNNQAWRTVEVTGAGTLSGSWSYAWTVGSFAQGKHHVAARAWDVAGNISSVAERDILVDRLAPTSALTDNTFVVQSPARQTGMALTLAGVSNDAGNAPLPSSPKTLAASMDVLTDTTVWLGVPAVADAALGVVPAWLGDLNNDRMADLAVGLPAAAEQAGEVRLVYGRAGDWATPPTPEMLTSHTKVLTGEAGRKLGTLVSAAGDANGDGLADLVVGEANSQHAFLVWGAPQQIDSATLSAPANSFAVQLDADAPITGLNWASDVNDDGLDDLLVLVGTNAYLLLGQGNPWPLYVDVEDDAAAVFSGVLSITGLGDIDGDLIGDLAAARANAVDLYLGSATLAREAGQTLSAAHTFDTADAAPSLAPLGDTNGDTPTPLADFAYSDGSTPHVVLGRASGSWAVSQSLSGLAGYLVGVGDVNADGYGDLLARVSGSDDASLRYGGSLGVNRAAFNDVKTAAGAIYSAAADINADGSADMVFVPTNAVASERGYGLLSFAAAPFLSPDALPVGAEALSGAVGQQDRDGAGMTGPHLTAGATYYVDDDGATTRCPTCASTIQSAINSASSGDTIVVYPGVYARFSIGSGKDNLTVRGMNPDSVFADGGGAASVIALDNVSGVTLSHFTLRNATAGIALTLAGVGGNTDSSLRINVDRVASVCAQGVTMDSASSVNITNSTLAASTRHLTVSDASVGGAWTSMVTPSIQTNAGGGLVASRRSGSDRLYAIRGSGNKTVCHADMDSPTSWSTIDSPVSFAPNSVFVPASNTGGLLAVSANPVPGVTSNIIGMTVSGSGKIYTAHADGSVRCWNGSSWTASSQTFSGLNVIGAGGDYVFVGAGADVWKYNETSGNLTFTKVLHVWNYAESCFYTNPVECNWAGCPEICRTIEDTSPAASINALLVDGNNLYVGGSFDRVGDIPIECSIEHDPVAAPCPLSDIDTGYYNLLKFDISAGTYSKLGLDDCHNGVGASGDVVRALALNGGYLYIGGHFQAHYGSPAVTSPHFIRMGVSAETFEACNGGLEGTDHQVYALAVQGSYVLVGGSFDTVGSAGSPTTAGNLARFNTSTNTWASGEGSVVATNGLVRDIEVYSTTYFYVAGDFTQIASSYTSNRIAKFSSSGSPYSEWGATGANAAVYALAVVGATLYAGGAFTQIGVGSAGSGRAIRFSQMDDSGSNTWAAEYTLWLAGSSDAWFYFTPPAANIGEGAAATSDGADGIYLLTGGGATSFYSLAWGGGSWTQLDNLPVAANAGTALVRAWDSSLGRMVVLAAIGGSNQIYRYDPSAASGSRWSAGGTLPSGYSFSTGASMAWDGVSDGSSKVYVLTGGSSGNNSRAFFSYSGGAFTTLGDGNPSTTSDDDFPVSLGAGGGLVADVADGQLLALPGRGVNPPTLYQYEPIGSGIPVGRLIMSTCALVAPTGETSFTWLTPEATSMSTFNLAISNNTFVGQSGITWTPSTGGYSGSTTLTHAQAAFADTTRGLYRTNNSTLTRGYYTYKGEVYVSPNYCPTCANDGRTWGTNAFNSIQTAINSGARIVRVLPGAYREALQLVSGVSLYGAGAELTILEPKTVSAGAVVKGEGVTNVSLVGLSIVGNGAAEGVHLDAGAQAGLIKRVIVRGASNGIGLDGDGTQVQVLNCDLVSNAKGLVATNKAWLQVRNTVIANNSTTGVQYDSTATTVSHTYNDYWGNGTNLSPAGAGAGELFLDPLFTDAASRNYRPLEASPLIDAGAISDAVPTGAGGRIDIGYREYGAASFYASPAYCSTCANDGLDWQVNAFGSAQNALDAAAAEVRVLASALDMRRSPLVTVSLAAGTYNEQLTAPSYVNLVGAGADRTIINAGGAYALSFDGVVAAQAEGLRLTGAATAGLLVTNSSAAITVTRSILTGNAVGARFDARSSGVIEFTTIVTNTGAGVISNAAHTHATVRNSLIAHNAQGLVSTNSGLVANDYNLLYNTADLSAVTAGENTISSAPLLNGYNLTAASPAVDAADPTADAPVGGGRRADLGWRELLALPIPLYFGAEHDSIVTANSGVAGVEVGVVAVADASEPVTATTPSAWTAGALASSGDCVSTWTTSYTPSASGLHRIYARARDVVNNREDDENEWYIGSFVADSAAPLVAWVDPTTNTSTGSAAVKLQARAYDYISDGSTTNFNVRSAWFTVDGVRLGSEWDDTGFDPAALTYRKFYAWAPLTTGAHTVVAWAEDASGRQTSTGSLTITVSGASHVATVTSIAEGGYTRLSSLPLEGYVRFVTNGEGSVSVSVDGGGAVAATLADPNAVVSAWTASAALSSDGSHAITLTPQRGTTGSVTTLNVTRDTTLPSLTVTKPQSGDYVTRTVTFEGTASDATAGLDRVEVSLDGGYSWREATVSGGSYSLDWSVDGAQDFDSYPASVRAVDRAGNVQEADAPVTVDNTPPTPLGSTTFSKPVGQFVEVGTLLGVTWSEAFDASGVVEVLVDADQNADTTPTTERSGAYVDLTLNALGEWYVHVAVRDAAGNAVISHYGPWYTRRTTGDLVNQQQRIIVDGYMDLANGEWNAATQQLDDDERSGRSCSLYTVWDGADFYLGWQNAYWGIDGDLMTYLALGGAGGTRDPIRPLAQGQLPSPANVCIEITGVTSGTLWLHDGGWVSRPLAFAVGPTGDTEIRVPWADMADGAVLDATGRRLAAAPSSLSMLALALDPDGNVNSVFPTSNGVSGTLTSSYNWGDLGSNPNDSVPQTKHATLSVSSPQVGGAAWGPSNAITYTIAVRNLEATALTGLKLALAASPGLSLMTYTGATCAAACTSGASAWLLVAPEVAAGNAVTITVVGQLAANLSAYKQVTMTTVLTADYALTDAPVSAQVTHNVDGQAPTLSFSSPIGVIGPNATNILGVASDGDGVGVMKVELSVDGGSWQTINGTIAWSAVVTPGASASNVALKARATDGYNQQSSEASLNLTVDRLAPAVSLDLSSPLAGRYAAVTGVASDATGVTAVEVQLDDESAWRPAQVISAPAGDAQPYNWVWSLPAEDNAPHRLRVRALDTVGNIGMTDWFDLQVDSIAPEVTATQVVSSVVATGDGESSLDSASAPADAESVQVAEAERALRITRVERAGLLAERTTVMTGTVTDGGGVASIWMRIYDPLGKAYTQPVTLVGDAWSYNMDTYNLPTGSYRLHIETTDAAGNSTTYGPWNLEVEEQALAGLQAYSNAPQAVGSAVAFSATVTAGSNVSYTWAFGDGQTGSGRLVTHSYSAAGTYTATVTASNSLSQTSASVSLLIATPVGSVTVDNDGPTVLGNQTILTASASGSNLTYNWTLGDGATASGAIVTHTYAAVGSYSATVVVSNSVSSSTAATTVEVDAPIQGLTATNDGPTALGSMTGLLAEVSAGSRISYTWAFGDGASADGAAVKHAYPDGGSYTAVVTASNSVSSQSAQTLVNVIGSSDALRVTPLGEFYCAGWNHGFEISYTNESQAAIGDVIVTINVPTRTLVLYDLSSPDMIVDEGAGTVSWNLGMVEGPSTVTRLLVLHFFTSIENEGVVQVNASAECAVCPPTFASASVVVSTGGMCLLPQPTFTPTPTRGPTPTPTITPTPSVTPTSGPTPTPLLLDLPLIMRNYVE